MKITKRARVTDCRVRMFCVGFGDCFLLTFGYGKAVRYHVLIDFGTTRQAPDGPDPVAVAKQIAATIGDDPWIIVATHRHKDHISGFSGKSWEILRALRGQVQLVLQPWTEQPDLARNATAPRTTADRGLVAALGALPVHLHQALRFTDLHEPSLAKSVVDEVRFIADDNLPNRAAIRNLASFGRRCRYLCAGDTRVASAIPGVKLSVLGPPTTRQWAALRKQTARSDQFWHLRGLATSALGAAAKHGPPLDRRAAGDRPAAATAWFQARVTQALGHQVLGMVRALDGAMNNTSLILLFEVGDAVLLFPGDAQIENWSFALADRRYRKSLERVTFYKVGHHGSLNATPHSLWDQLANRRDRKGKRGALQSALSTLAGVHGKTARGTEVPRSKLVDAIAAGSQLARTDVGHEPMTIIDVPIRATRAASPARRRKRR